MSCFPNIASHQKDEHRDNAVATMVAELNAAGIRATVFPGDQANSEVPGFVIGTLSMWTFERLWYYWSAKGPGLPVETAEALYTTHGTQARVDGHCGCPSPRDRFKGFGVGRYHVDTPAGLLALANAIRSVYDAAKDPRAEPYCGSEIKLGLVQDFRRGATR